MLCSKKWTSYLNNKTKNMNNKKSWNDPYFPIVEDFLPGPYQITGAHRAATSKRITILDHFALSMLQNMDSRIETSKLGELCVSEAKKILKELGYSE